MRVTASLFANGPGGWIIAAGAVFVLDLLMPLGYAAPMLYVLPILLTWRMPGWKSTGLAAGSVIMLTWLRIFYFHGEFTSEILMRRTMASALLLVIAGLLVKQKQAAVRVANAHEVLRASETFLSSIVENLPNMVFIKDAATLRFVRVNKAAEDLIGHSRTALLGKNDYDFFPEDQARFFTAKDRAVLDSGRLLDIPEEPLQTNDKGLRYLHTKKIPLYNETGDPQYLVGISEDITARKQAEEALQKLNATLEQRVVERAADLVTANERFEWVTKATHDGIWDWDLLHDTVYFSPRWKAMHGFQEADECESIPEWSARIHPEDRERVVGKLQDYLAGRHHEFWEEYRIRQKNSTYMWVLDRGVALWNQEGRAVRMVGAETDITWRKEAEETMRRRAHEFRTLADNVPALFSYVDRDQRYRFVNRRYEEVFGVAATRIVGMSIQDLLGSQGYALVQPYLDAAFKGEAVTFETCLPMSGMREYWFSVQYVPDLDEQGNVAGLFVLATNITSLKVTEAALRQREAQLESLSAKLLQTQEDERRRIARELHDDFAQRLAMLAIDLRTARLDPLDSDPSGAVQLQQLGDSAERLATDLQQMAHHLHPTILEHAGLEAAVREQVDEFAARTGLLAELMVREVPRTVPLEQATCLYRVLQESLQNVRKHAKATAVLVRIMRTGRGLGLCVHDDGSGFESRQLARRRNGLGLISMEERVKLLNGKFRIRTKPGGGTEVHAWVPLQDVKSDA